MINRKIVAREWLYLVGCFVVGLILFILITSENPKSHFQTGGILILLFFPYVLIQLIRSIVWALKTVIKK